MKNPISAAQRGELQIALQLRLAQLTASAATHLGGQPRAEHARELLLQDADDAPQREGEREMDLALTDRDAVALGAIADALRRIDDGRYGDCADCGKPIPFARLQVEPWALRCVGCEALREHAAQGAGPRA